MVVSNSISGSNTLKFDDVIGVILSEETRRKILGGSTLGSVLSAQSRGKMIKRGNNLANHGKSRGKSKGKRYQPRGPRDCWCCGKPGHKKKYFLTWKNNERDKQKGIKEINVVSNKSEEDVFLLWLEYVNVS